MCLMRKLMMHPRRVSIKNLRWIHLPVVGWPVEDDTPAVMVEHRAKDNIILVGAAVKHVHSLDME